MKHFVEYLLVTALALIIGASVLKSQILQPVRAIVTQTAERITQP